MAERILSDRASSADWRCRCCNSRTTSAMRGTSAGMRGESHGASVARSQLSCSAIARVCRVMSHELRPGPGRRPSVCRICTASARSGSDSSSVRTPCHQRDIRSCADTSGNTSTTGGSPAAIGCSARMRWAKECRVPIAAASRSANATRARGDVAASLPSLARTASRRSEAAASVNVTAAIERMSAPASTRLTTRLTSTVVLPEPAPAATTTVSSIAFPARSRACSSTSVVLIPRLRSPRSTRTAGSRRPTPGNPLSSSAPGTHPRRTRGSRSRPSR